MCQCWRCYPLCCSLKQHGLQACGSLRHCPACDLRRTGGCLELKTTKLSHWEQFAASTEELPPELLARFKVRAC